MITAVMLEDLARAVKSRLSGKRFNHTLAVAKMARYLALCCEVDGCVAEAAALLHDVTKELSEDEHLSLLAKEGIVLNQDDLDSPQIWHSYTAPILIKRDFPLFAYPEILSATEKHTVGDGDMQVLDCIIFLADFIEETRTYPSSVQVRKYVFENMQEGKNLENLRVLFTACIKSIDFTVEHLSSTNKKLNPKTLLTRNALLSKI